MATKKLEKQRIPPVWFVQIVYRFRYFLKRKSRRMMPPSLVAFEMVQEFWLAKAIAVVTELNIAEILEDGPLEICELASLTGTNEDALYRLMRLVSSNEIFHEEKNRVFRQTKLSSGLLSDNAMKYTLLLHAGDMNWALFGELLSCVKTGESASQRVFGTDLFNHLRTNDAANEIFNRSMHASTQLGANAILHSFNFSEFSTIADIGGGTGLLLASILEKNIYLKGILLDLPNVVKDADEIFLQANVSERAMSCSFDFFTGDVPSANCYLLKNVLHDWGDDECLAILRNLKKHFPAGAVLLIIEAVIEKPNKPSFGKLMDIQMLVGTKKGRERTLEEFRTLVGKAGFTFQRRIKTVAPFDVIMVHCKRGSSL